MTELATRPAPPAPGYDWDGTLDRAPVNRPLSQGERMREWLHLFTECRAAAEILARTSFVPKDMMGKPAEIATAMLKGWELGLDPLDALASIYVVHGRVGFYAEFMRRRMIQAGHVFRVVESNDNRCIVEGSRADNGETHRAVFTADQAKRAKIDIAAYPAEKLIARATSRLVKQAFPDVLSGSLIVEDLLDGVVSVDAERVDAPDSASAPAAAVQRKRQPRTVRATPPPAPAAASYDDLLDDEVQQQPAREQASAELSSDDATGAHRDSEPGPDEPASVAQNRKMHALFRDAGVEDRQERLTITGKLLGIADLSSSGGLTKNEASTLIDQLQRWVDDGDAAAEIRDILMAADAASGDQQ